MRKTTALLVALLAFHLGKLYAVWRMLRLPIDEYHAVRMEIEDRLQVIKTHLNDLNDGGGA